MLSSGRVVSMEWVASAATGPDAFTTRFPALGAALSDPAACALALVGLPVHATCHGGRLWHASPRGGQHGNHCTVVFGNRLEAKRAGSVLPHFWAPQPLFRTR